MLVAECEVDEANPMRFKTVTPESADYARVDRKLVSPARFDYDALAQHYNAQMEAGDIVVFDYPPKSVSNLKTMMAHRGLSFGVDYRCRGQNEKNGHFTMFIKKMSDTPMCLAAELPPKNKPGRRRRASQRARPEGETVARAGFQNLPLDSPPSLPPSPEGGKKKCQPP